MVEMDGEHSPLKRKEAPTCLLWIVVAFSAITGLLMGFDLSVVAVVLNPIQAEFNICPPQQFSCFKRELFVAMVAPGALCGSLGGGVFADAVGRKIALIASDVFLIAGSIVFFFAQSWAELLIGRVVIGIGIGIGFVIFSTYVTEIAPPDRRGRLLVCQEIAQCIGVLVTYLAASIVGDRYWRYLLCAGGVCALVQLGGMFFLPESPRWLLLKGRDAEAAVVMEQLGMEDLVANVDSDINSPSNKTASSASLSSQSWKSKLFACKKSLIIASFVAVAQNLLCTNAALYYSTDLMLLAGVCKPYEWGIGLGLTKLLGTIVVYALVDRLGRRRLLIWGTIGLSASFALLTGAFSFLPEEDFTKAALFCQSAAGSQLPESGLAGWYSGFVIVGLLSMVFSWETSWASLMYVVSAEILPSNVRGLAMGIVVFNFWISLFISQLSFELLLRTASITGTFGVLCAMGIPVACCTYLFVPDATGLSLENVSDHLSSDQPNSSCSEGRYSSALLIS